MGKEQFNMKWIAVTPQDNQVNGNYYLIFAPDAIS